MRKFQILRRFLCSNVNIRKTYIRTYTNSSFASQKFKFENSKNLKLGFRRFASDLPPHKIAKLPNLSPTMDTGTIQSWTKNEGDKLNEGDVLCQVETDKAVMAMETPYPGYLAKILIPAGTKNIQVGAAIAIIVKMSDEVAQFKNYSASSAAPATESKPTQKATAPDQETSHKEVSQKHTHTTKTISPSDGKSTNFATPYAKTLAKNAQMDLKNMTGSGPGGLITGRDVSGAIGGGVSSHSQKISEKAVSATPGKVTHAQSYTDIELTSMRSTIAKRLALSASSIPHFYLFIDIEMDKLMALRADINKQMGDKGKISINDFLIKAASLALQKVPECNSQWHDTYIRRFHKTDISVAVSTEAGLITPIVFDASSKSISCISQEVKILAEKAKANKLTPAEFQGGTFTISNLGMFGISDFTAIINPPQSCILAVGGLTQKYASGGSDSQHGFKNYIRVSLGCDHRVVDGAVGATWLKTFKDLLEAPYSVLV